MSDKASIVGLVVFSVLAVYAIACMCTPRESYTEPSLLNYAGKYAVLQGKSDLFGFQGENQGRWGYARYWSEREVGEDVLNNPDERSAYDKENDLAFQKASVLDAGNNMAKLELSGKTNSGGSYTSDAIYPGWLSGNGNLRCNKKGDCVFLTSATANSPVKAAWSMIRDPQRNLEERIRFGYIRQELDNAKLY